MSNRIFYLDGLRGWAALVVFFAHLFRQLLLPYNSVEPDGLVQYLMYKTPLYILFHSSIAVKAFFVVSGFSLSYGFFKTNDYVLLKRMAVFRVFRLGIPMLFSALMAYFFMKTHLNFNQEAAQILGSKWLLKLYNFDASFFDATYGTLTYNLTGFGEVYNKYNVGFWTMPFEFRASMAIFLLLAIFGKYQVRYVIYFLFVYFLKESMFLGFVLGVMVCDLTVNGRIQEKIRSLVDPLNLRRVEILLLVCLVCFFWAMRGFQHFTSILTYYVVNESFLEFVLPTVLVVLATLNGFVSRIFSTPVSVFLGKISFSLYLVHIPIITSFSCWGFVNWHDVVEDKLLLAVIIGVPTFVLTIITSYIFHDLVENRIMMYAKRRVMMIFG
ncbi:MAG: acyltransferase [Magnetococcales bacterium]|nr:acyltransferase [Magnetococcales bacterium]